MEKFEVSGRFYASIQHIQSAALFARHAHIIEADDISEVNGERLAEQRAYVTGTIFTSIAFLEATINEFFDDAADGPEEYLKAMSNEEKAN